MRGWTIGFLLAVGAALGVVAFNAVAQDRENDAAKVPVPGMEGREKSAAVVRAERRLFDGAPPVIPHAFRGACLSCHTERGLEVEGLGFAPPMPHERTQGLSAISNCTQCHVFKQTDDVFVENEFAGLRQDLRKGDRLNPITPPVIPHRVFMRENCFACHTGPAAREPVRTTHPERVRCRQCHVPQTTEREFSGIDLSVSSPQEEPSSENRK